MVSQLPYHRFVIPALVFLALTVGYPLVTLVRMAFGSVTVSNLGGAWAWVGLANFQSAFASPFFAPSILSTAEFTAALLVFDLIVGFIVAEWIKRPGRLAGFTQTVMMIGWALPVLVTGTIWRFMLLNNGFLNQLLRWVGASPVEWLSSSSVALWGVLIAVAWASLPFCALVIRGGLMSIPEETLEAATMDGAGWLATTIQIVLPQMRNTIGTLAVLIITYGFGTSFAFIEVMTAGGPGTATTTLPVLGYSDSFQTFNFGPGAAIALLSMAIVVALSVGLFRLSREAWRTS
jgi:multiple sugar transport system permease protein